MKVVYYDKIELEKKGDEKTAIRFTLNPDGESDFAVAPGPNKSAA